MQDFEICPVGTKESLLKLEEENKELYNALKTAMKYFDQVIIETGYQSEGEAIAHYKCKQALSNADKD